jgi:hypothetical protein
MNDEMKKKFEQFLLDEEKKKSETAGEEGPVIEDQIKVFDPKQSLRTLRADLALYSREGSRAGLKNLFSRTYRMFGGEN